MKGPQKWGQSDSLNATVSIGEALEQGGFLTLSFLATKTELTVMNFTAVGSIQAKMIKRRTPVIMREPDQFTYFLYYNESEQDSTVCRAV